MTTTPKKPDITPLTPIKVKEIPKYRAMYALKQKYQCGICKKPLGTATMALDHDHDTGHIRGTLCMPCNRSEGKVKAGAKYMQKVTHLAKTNYIKFLINLVKYLVYHQKNPSNIIHPTFDLELGKTKPTKRKRNVKKSKTS